MKSLRVFDGHLRYAVLAVTLVLAAVAPAFASAAQLTERSVALSSSSKNASGVSYQIGFTADNTDAAAVAVEFCSNSPLVGDDCTAPGNDFDVATAGGATGATKVGTWTANRAFVTLAVASGANTFTITGAHNPSVAGTIYARIVTYDTSAHAQAYTSTALGSGVVDQGSVAISITDTIGVSGSVRESLVFCVSGEEPVGHTDPITASCGGTLTAPTLKLGAEVETGVFALDASDVYTGDIYTQISTNALSGAVVSLKSTAGTAGCAGLALNGTGACNIAAAGTTGTFSAGAAKFGVKLTLPADNVTNGTIAVGSDYSTDDYRLDGAGATSTYGDALYNTSAGYASNLNTKLTFGATAANNTPAGKYSADISLIATGTF